MKNLKIGEKVTKVPLIQGGMGVGISLSSLAGTVAKEGGIGILSSAQIGYKEPDLTQIQARQIEGRSKRDGKARKISPDGIIGFNIMTALKDYAQHVKAAVQAGADLIISGAGLPTELPALTQESGTKIAPIVSTDRSAQIILKYWDRKYNRTADLVVIEGPLAAGHLGFKKRKSKPIWERHTKQKYRKILRTVRCYAEKYGRYIPVVTAGGIYDSADVKEALADGIDGVQIATRFVTTEECDAHIRYKRAYIRAAQEDIVLIKARLACRAGLF